MSLFTLLVAACLVAAASCNVVAFAGLHEETNFDYEPRSDRVTRDLAHQDHIEADSGRLKFVVDKHSRSLSKRQTIEANNVLLRSQPLKSVAVASVDNENDPSGGMCVHSNIKSLISTCFHNSNDCNSMLDCVASLDIVANCSKFNMVTPSVWIAKVYELLHVNSFCSLRIDCKSNENEHLRILDSILRTVFDFGPVYLNQPKVDNKMYCSKSHHLVSNVKEIFDTMENCFAEHDLSTILDVIDESASSILDRKCAYCISGKLIFDDCLTDSCNASLSCVYDKIRMYKCSKDRDTTPLTLFSSFMRNISHVCTLESGGVSNDTDTSVSSIIDWFRSLDSCIKTRNFLGLTRKEAPPSVDICRQMEETFKCVHGSLHKHDGIKSKIRYQFSQFAQQYTRMQRACEATASQQSSTSTRLPTPNGAAGVAAASSSTRHSFSNTSEQTVFEDNKNYYHETIVRAELDQIINWVNLDSHKFKDFHVKKDDDLSKNYLKATIVKLKFKFPYYGHLLDQIVVATGGFIYVGSLMNPLITKAQYIAPLMANFDPTLNNRTVIKYVDNGTHFVCTWENLVLQDQPENGEYTFQVILNKFGVIMFNYKKIPTTNISNINHTVKIGLSDAYIYYKILTSSKIEYTIVQYHVVNVLLENVKTGNSIMFFMLKNCLQLKSCDTCVKSVGNFKCIWCPALQRCSDTMDRYRQEWIESSCPIDYAQANSTTCSVFQSISALEGSSLASDTPHESDYIKSVIVGLFLTLTIAMVVTLASWSVYAYKNPTSPSGIWLIEHRPTRLARMFMSYLDKSSPGSARFQNPVA